jgi:glycosyltransferase involved in cell wall biosynthesis
MNKLSIIIPVYNEKNTIIKLLEQVLEVELYNIEKEIIVIDDKSTDGTKEILEEYEEKLKNQEIKNIKIIFKEENKGKGNSVKKGFLLCTGNILIIQDADLEYNPNEYLEVINPIIKKKADIVYGSRFISSKPHRVLYFWHYLGNRILTTFSNILTNLNLTDMETCYKAFNRKTIEYLKNKISSNRFGIEPEITALISKNKDLKIYEVGISYSGRTYREGKKINWKDGLAAFYYIIKFNLFKKW